MYAEFMKFATDMISSERKLMVYIPIFLAILTLFLLSVTFELRSLWSSAPVSFNTKQVFYQFQPGSTTPWTVLIFIQTVWGLAFIK